MTHEPIEVMPTMLVRPAPTRVFPAAEGCRALISSYFVLCLPIQVVRSGDDGSEASKSRGRLAWPRTAVASGGGDREEVKSDQAI